MQDQKQIRRLSSANPLIRPFSAQIRKFPPVDNLSANRQRTSFSLGTPRSRGLISSASISPRGLSSHLAKYDTSENAQPLPSNEALITIFQAKCSQLRILPTEERQDRFIEIVHKNSSGGTLALPDTGLGPVAGAAVAALLEREPIFRSVNLAGNGLRDEGARTLARTLRGGGRVTALDLRSNDIGAEGGAALFEALLENRALTELDLGVLGASSRNRIGPAAAGAIAAALAGNGTLQSLSLHGNGLGPRGAATVAAEGLARNTTLRSLDLGTNGLQDDGMEAVAPALCQAALESLGLAHNAIGSRGMRAIAGILGGGGLLLQTLDLTGNDIRPRAADDISDALERNSLLCSLRLDRNGLGPDGTIGLARGLGASASLTSVSLAGNSMYDRGAKAIAEVVLNGGAPRLTRLDLRDNKIGDPGAQALAEGIASHLGLTALDLNDNFVGDAGASFLADSLATNDSLRSLGLRNNKLHDPAGRALVLALRSNTALTQLDVGWNDLNYPNFQAISKIIAAHAERFRQGAVPRLQWELSRLRREEPKLAVRQAELGEHGRARQEYLAEATRLAKQRRALASQTEVTLGELREGLREAHKELEDKREEYRAAQTALEAAEREQAPYLAGLAARGALQRDETRGVRTAAEAAARALRLEEEEVAEEERIVRAKMEANEVDKAKLRRVIAEATERMAALHAPPPPQAMAAAPPAAAPARTPARQAVVTAGSGASTARAGSAATRSGAAAAAVAGRPKSAAPPPRKK